MLKTILIILAVIVILGGLGALNDGIIGFRTQQVTDTFLLATNTSQTTGNVQLTHTLWDNDITNATVSSNLTADTPVINDYTSGNRQLALTGLSNNITRVITATYKTAGLSNYPGADSGIKFLPALFVIALILLPAIAIVIAVKNA